MARPKKVIVKTTKEYNEIVVSDLVYSKIKNCKFEQDSLYGTIVDIEKDKNCMIRRVDGEVFPYSKEVFNKWFYVKI